MRWRWVDEAAGRAGRRGLPSSRRRNVARSRARRRRRAGRSAHGLGGAEVGAVPARATCPDWRVCPVGESHAVPLLPVSWILTVSMAWACISGAGRSEPSRLAATQTEPVWLVLTNTYPVLDTSRVVLLGDTLQVFRTDITLRFKVGIADSAMRDFFNRHAMSVAGVTQSGQFFVRIPDPGPSAQDLFTALDVLRGEPEISIVAFIPRTPLPQRDF
jgi:hypothetical protein